MLIVKGVGPGVVAYFVPGRTGGSWTPGAQRLLGLEGPVDATSLYRLLQGREPASGRFLPAVRRRGRRAGWDLIFCAPKSLSLLAATASRPVSSVMTASHEAAVAALVDHLEDRLTVGPAGPDGRPRRVEGLVGAGFLHTTSAAEEPHIHTHLLVANLSRRAGVWRAVSPQMWTADRRAVAALYQLALREQLVIRGCNLEWRLRPDSLADLAGVTRAAVRAVSTQARAAGNLGRFEARHGAVRQAWTEKLGPAGYDAAEVASAIRPSPASLEDPQLRRAVAVRLSAARSDFREADVLVALAGCHPGGASVAKALAWVEGFCAESHEVPSPTRSPRWATSAALRADQLLEASLEARVRPPELARPERRIEPQPRVARPTLARPGGGLQIPAAERPRAVIAASGRPTDDQQITVLGTTPGQTWLLAQAELVDTWRTAWEAAGQKVTVRSPDPAGGRRWTVLAGLDPFRPGDGSDVVVVDQADRQTTAALIQLMSESPARLVLVEGGTLPRLTNPASHGLRDFADRTGRHLVQPHRPWSPVPDIEVPASGRDSAEHLLGQWHEAGRRPLMVGLGPEEVRALNQAALGGPRPSAGSERFRPGDRAVVLHSGGEGLGRYGQFGTVLDSSRKTGVCFAWEGTGRSVVSDKRLLASVGFGYAVTPHLAAGSTRPLMVLGPAEVMGRDRGRVIAEVSRAREGPGRDRVRQTGRALEL